MFFQRLQITPAFILKLWNQLKNAPAGKWIFSKAVGFFAPYSSTMGACIEELSPGKVRVVLKDRRKVRNHLASIHAVAIANLGEMATGLALNTAIPDSARAILVSLRVQYLKKARGSLEALCEQTPLTSDKVQDLEVKGRILDKNHNVVAEVFATWRVGPRPLSPLNSGNSNGGDSRKTRNPPIL